MGSDGLFDNLFDREILSIVKSQLSAFTLPGSGNRPPRMLSIEPQKISDALAERAKAVSNSKLNVDSPFQVRAVNEGLYYQVGHLFLQQKVIDFNMWIIGRKSG